MLDWNKIVEISVGLDDHLRKFESLKTVLEEVKLSLDSFKKSQEQQFIYELNKMKRDIADMADQLKRHGIPLSNNYEKSLSEIRELLDSDQWPIAVPPECFCDSDDKKVIRAENLLDMFVGEHLKGKKILDYGCGEGHTIPAAMQREAELALGYDVNIDQIKFTKDNFTNSFEIVKSNAPYDIILISDVLDHITMIDPIEALRQISTILLSTGRVYVRNHPWSSRHGGHVYLQKNKAFLHLIMDEVELTRCGGLQAEYNVKVVTPLETYRYWFDQSGFQIKSELPLRTNVEEFFLKPSFIRDKLNKHWQNPEAISNYLEIDFVEYVLQLKDPATNTVIF